jgi:DNA-binding CsgD family transcriptional regulator
MAKSSFFTKTEEKVLRLAFTGKTARQVGELLFCSKRTVDFHLANIYDKLDVPNKMMAYQKVKEFKLLEGI